MGYGLVSLRTRAAREGLGVRRFRPLDDRRWARQSVARVVGIRAIESETRPGAPIVLPRLSRGPARPAKGSASASG